jgi:pSer/pThr/pTyr-binding forkhead associated (FHA) protein
MMQRILVRHTSGTRANQVDDFPAEGFRELQIGRDEAATVRYDSDREDLVSRNHARIYAEPAGSGSFYIADLQSRNGTFLNRQRISAPSRIHHGDLVQLGSGGPEFRFEQDPPPASTARPTRVVSPAEASNLSTSAKPTRIGVAADTSSPRPIGRATVERMLDDTFGKVKRESGKTLWAGIATVILIAVFGVGSYLYLRNSTSENARHLQDQQLLLLQMAQVVKQQPTDDAAARAQLEKLSGDMRRIIAQKEASKRNDAGSAEQSTASSDGSPAAATNYEAGLTQAEQLYNTNDYAGAYAASVQISQLDPSRWEGYYIAGLSAEGLNKPEDALTAYQYALSEAPGDAKAKISARIDALQGSAAQAN